MRSCSGARFHDEHTARLIALGSPPPRGTSKGASLSSWWRWDQNVIRHRAIVSARVGNGAGPQPCSCCAGFRPEGNREPGIERVPMLGRASGG